MAMQNMQELASIYGAWNPEAYIQGADNVRRSGRLDDEAYTAAQGRNEEQTLANQFASQLNPMKLETQQISNEGLALGNVGKQVANTGAQMDLERKIASQMETLDADRRKEALQKGSDELVSYDQKTQQMFQSLDPREQQEAQRRYEKSQAFRTYAQKQEAEMAKERFKESEATKRTGMSNRTSVEVARIGADSRDRVAATRTAPLLKPPKTATEAWVRSLQGELQAGRITPEQYQTSIVEMVNADLAAKSGKNALGVTPVMTPGGGMEIQNKPPAPQLTLPGRQPAAPAKPQVPAVGTQKDGWTFLGGNPADPKSWRK